MKGRKEDFSERLDGEQGLGGMTWRTSKRVSRQRGGVGGHKASFVSVLAAALAAAKKKKKKMLRGKRMDGWWHGGLNSLA